MWNDIRDKKTLEEFMESMDFFHDSCIKEMKYISGAYVEEDLGMYPVNDRRILSVIIQRQYKENSMIEMEFSGMKYLHLKPVVKEWTGEINDSAMILKEDCVYWCDCWGFTEETIKECTGTVICAEKVRWRSVEGHMGNGEVFRSVI